MQTERAAYKRFFIDPLLGIVAAVIFGLIRILPPRFTSALGGWLARTIGPHLRITERAVRNLQQAFPEKTETDITVIIGDMWENLGRTAAEYANVSFINVYDPSGPVEVIGAEYIDLLRDDNKPGIFFSAHIGNWELAPLATAQRGLILDQIYRAANNRMVEWLFKHRQATISGELIAKGPQGARQLLKSLQNGRHLGMLVDQKMNDGIPVPFFGRDAMTAPALAELALRYDCPVVPARVERLGGMRFRLTIEPPLEFTPTGDRHTDVAAMMALVNQRLETWIRDTPAQWLWLHNRWPDEQ